jgi:hypothetical protein
MDTPKNHNISGTSRSMRERLYLALTATAAGISLGVYTPAELFLWHNTIYGLITAALGSIYLLLFYLARRHHRFAYSLACLVIVPFDMLWPFFEG